MISNRFLSIIVLFCVPVLFVFLNNNTITLQGPYYQAYYSDPSYAYLMNSLNIANGELPGHTDHPGTTVQLLGGLVLEVSKRIDEVKGIESSSTIKVLRNPEQYISYISYLLVGIISIAVFIFGYQTYAETRSLGLAVISQSFPLAFSTLHEHLPRLEPEPLLIASSYLLATTLIPVATGSVSKKSPKLIAVMAGTILGIGVVTKITFAPLVLFLFAFPGKKAKFYCGAAFVITIIILTIPIWESIPAVVDWIFRLLTHSGRYGSGEAGLPPFSRLISYGTDLFKATPIIFCFLPLLVVSIFTAKKGDKHSGLVNLLIVSFLVITCSILITIKHPSAHYLMPVIGLSGFFVMIIMQGCFRKNYYFQIVVISIICALVVYKAVGQTKEKLLHYHTMHSDLKWLQNTAQQYNCRTVNYYRSSSQPYALQFGNDFARRIYQKELRALYPEYIGYNIWSKRFSGFKGDLSEPEVDNLLQHPNPICLTGTVSLPLNVRPTVVPIEKKGKFMLYKILDFHGNNLTKIIRKED